MSARALWTHLEQAVLHRTDRSSASGDGFDAKSASRYLGLPNPMLGLIGKLPGMPRNVGARTAHIKVDEMSDRSRTSQIRRSHHTTCGTTEQAVDRTVLRTIQEPP